MSDCDGRILVRSHIVVVNRSRRGVIAFLAALAITLSLLAAIPAAAQTDPLPSWNEGPAKQALLKFAQATTDPSSPSFVAPPDRIATFDQDGTLWVEHPMYSQVVYCLDRVPALVKEKPELADVEPFKTVLSGDREAIAKLPKDDLIKVLEATLTGMSVAVPDRGKELAWDSQGPALEATVHRAGLPTDDGASKIPAR